MNDRKSFFKNGKTFSVKNGNYHKNRFIMEMLPEFLKEYRGHRLVIKADSELTVEQYLLDITLF